MKRPPVPRPRIYDLYWYFASERQRMFERRVAGDKRVEFLIGKHGFYVHAK